MDRTSEILERMTARSTHVLRAGVVPAGEAEQYAKWLRGQVRDQADDAGRLSDVLAAAGRGHERVAARGVTMRSAAEDWPPAPAFGALHSLAAASLGGRQLRELEAGPVARLARAASLEEALRVDAQGPAEETFARALESWREQCVAARVDGRAVYEQDLAFTSAMKAMMSPQQRRAHTDAVIAAQLSQMEWPAPPPAAAAPEAAPEAPTPADLDRGPESGSVDFDL